jgi:hypothetical protein
MVFVVTPWGLKGPRMFTLHPYRFAIDLCIVLDVEASVLDHPFGPMPTNHGGNKVVSTIRSCKFDKGEAIDLS